MRRTIHCPWVAPLLLLLAACGDSSPPTTDQATANDLAMPVKADLSTPVGDDAKTGDDAMMGGDDAMMGGDDAMMGGDDAMMGGDDAGPDQAMAPSCMDGIKNGAETDVDCGGGTCPACDDGKACAGNMDCKGANCANGTCAAASSCMDGKKNGNETDVDCGGGTCPPCGDGKACGAGADCQSAVCSGGACAQPSCMDGAKNGKETDADCGGGTCPKCTAGQKCTANGDCDSGACMNGTCAAASCMDNSKNGMESDVDCGGSCPKCADGKVCGGAADCQSGVCSGGKCVAPTCMDKIQNGKETDVDCGGGGCGKCADGLACAAGGDCASGNCAMGKCVAASCMDMAKNGKETDVDCGGGTCGKCADGKVCVAAADCQSGVCTGGKCVAPACTDKVQNGKETDIDCGGPSGMGQMSCARCAAGQKCAADTDCASGLCDPMAKTCKSSCPNMKQDAGETDLDCGGPSCNIKCADGKKCAARTDCASGICTGGLCQIPNCNDTVQNGTETDVDCGGACIKKCDPNKKCNANSDCALPASGVCKNGVCAAATCMDAIKNATETDIDCGGVCGATCGDGKKCAKAGDCKNMICQNGVCAAAQCNDKTKNGAETDLDCGGGKPPIGAPQMGCTGCSPAKVCKAGTDCFDGLCLNGKCAAGTCTDKLLSGSETDVDCGGDNWCNRCTVYQKCGKNSDCTSGVCLTVGNVKQCLPHDCRELINLNPNAAGSNYYVSPDGQSAIQVICSNGWTVVSINGSLNIADTCRHRLRSDAPACGGGTPGLDKDWQISGADMNKFKFNQVLFYGYKPGGAPNTWIPYAATVADVVPPMGGGSTVTVGTGVLTLKNAGAALGLPALTCASPPASAISARVKLAVDVNGNSVWGLPTNAACGAQTGGVMDNLGLNVATTGDPNAKPHDGAGWDDNNNGCGCSNAFSPADILNVRGLFAIR